MEFTKSIIIIATFLLRCDSSLSQNVTQSFPRVATSLGTIEGLYKTSTNGRRYEAYLGIPYADPPIGESRFGIAKSISPWIGVLMAKQFGPVCMQYNSLSNDPSQRVLGFEDCLYMNIYTPVADNCERVNGKPNNLFPVIFYIHGGGFQSGSSKYFNPRHLLNRNVTLVVINYRVGSLGFLSTEDNIVPGNMGLKDQVVALRWVKDNIRSFGGDPSRISLFGQSTGGASVHYHYLTNLTAGLFQRGMSLSGTALHPWAQAENPLENTKKLATIVGCPTNDIPRMVRCLKGRPAHHIVEAAEKFASPLSNPVVPFGPVIEKGIHGKFTFIDRSPIDIINSGGAHDVPWITGIVSEEGLITTCLFTSNDILLKEINDNWETVAPYILDFNYTIPEIDHPKIAKLIKQHYLGTSAIGKSTFNQTASMIGDRTFGYSAEEAAKSMAKANQSPVLFYYFSYRGAHSFSEFLIGSNENLGTSHSDDESYLFELLFDPTTTQQDRNMQKKLMDIWVSFASDGIPDAGIEWPAVNGSIDNLDYLHIEGPDNYSVKSSLNFKEKNFWHSLGIHENENHITENLK